MTQCDEQLFDVMVLGSGMAALAAALTLARCRRRVLRIGCKPSRTVPHRIVRGYPGILSTTDEEFAATTEKQLGQFDCVHVIENEPATLTRVPIGYHATLECGREFLARKLLLAQIAEPDLPAWPGVCEHLGRGVYTCGYSDGWELRDQHVAVY